MDTALVICCYISTTAPDFFYSVKLFANAGLKTAQNTFCSVLSTLQMVPEEHQGVSQGMSAGGLQLGHKPEH